MDRNEIYFYLCEAKVLREHLIWKIPGLWEAALDESKIMKMNITVNMRYMQNALRKKGLFLFDFMVAIRHVLKINFHVHTFSHNLFGICSGVSAQIRKWAPVPVLWDTLTPTALNEAVIGERRKEKEAYKIRYDKIR